MSNSKFFDVANILNNKIFKNVTFIWNKKREVFFITKEVLDTLEYGDKRYRKDLLKRLIPNDKKYRFTLGEAENFGIENVIPKGHRYPQTVILTKPGLHLLLSLSGKKLAKDLNDWIFLEVIPSIEKQGYYIDYSQTKEEEEIRVLRDENKSLIERNEKLRLDLEARKRAPIIDETRDFEERNYYLERDAIDYRADIEELKEENEDLKKENESLEEKVVDIKEKVRDLEKENKKFREVLALVKEGISKI